PKAGKADPAARPDPGLKANKLPLACLLARPRTPKAATSSTQSAGSGHSRWRSACLLCADFVAKVG
ncbi:hypothetical protein, partial [Bradyrhizobium algeriense]|uniref:hypothetical protein n=1 Tax=Bradyrhizobium algeriense TaxID=634784 RepID=UPI001AECDDE8